MPATDLSEQLVKAGVSELPNAFRAILQYGKKFAGEQDLFNYAKTYKIVLEEEHSYMKILGMEKPIPIEDIYTEVRILSRVGARSYKSIDELEEETKKKITGKKRALIERDERLKIEEQIKLRNFRTLMQSVENEYLFEIETIEKTFRLREQEIIYQRNLELDEIYSALDENLTGFRKIQTEAKLSVYSEKIENIKKEMKIEKENLKKEKQEKIDAIRHKLLHRNLSEDELQEVESKLPVQVDQALQIEVRKELNKIVFDDFGHDRQYDSPSLPAWSAIADKKRVLVLGKPGSGKTTFFNHILLRQIRGVEGEEKFPVFVNLKEFADSGKNKIMDFIVDVFENCGFPQAKDFIERILQSPKLCLILFDGLDEVPVLSQKLIIREITNLSKKYRNNQFIVSCRTANYQGQLNEFTEVEIADFGPDQVTKFSYSWFGSDVKAATDFLLEIKQHSGLKELTSTPLLLTLLCITYKRNQKFPDQKALLYLACIDTLFIDWDTSRQIKRDNFVEKFDFESKKLLLAKIACDTFCEGVQFFSRQDLVSRIETISPIFPISQKNGGGILAEYAQHHGILIERARDIYSFSHLTLHEFFTAFHLSRNQPIAVINKVSAELWYDDNWKEVVVFLGGLLTYADSLLVSMRNYAKNKLAESGVGSLLFNVELNAGTNDYIKNKESIGESSLAWETWFRCKILSYKLYRCSMNTPEIAQPFQVTLHFHTKLIEKIYGLGIDLKHNLDRDRPLNLALKDCLSEIAISDELIQEVITNSEINSRYFGYISIILEILASRARILPNLRDTLIVDLFLYDLSNWDNPIIHQVNRLGA